MTFPVIELCTAKAVQIHFSEVVCVFISSSSLHSGLFQSVISARKEIKRKFASAMNMI